MSIDLVCHIYSIWYHLAVQPWALYLNSLCLYFLLFQVGLESNLLVKGCCEMRGDEAVQPQEELAQGRGLHGPGRLSAASRTPRSRLAAGRAPSPTLACLFILLLSVKLLSLGSNPRLLYFSSRLRDVAAWTLQTRALL